MKEREQNYHLNHVSDFNYISLDELIAQGQREIWSCGTAISQEDSGLGALS